MPENATEREVKLGSDLQLALPDLGALADRTVRLPEQHLLATYFDTPDFRLWARSITLRHRTGEEEGDGIWTLKLPRPSTGATLERTELEWDGPLDRPPSAATDLLRGLLRQAQLQKVATLQTDRGRLARTICWPSWTTTW
jgi:inorganic triphosphatase YgiF